MKSKNDVIRIVFAGGGTGGHIYPGIAVADETKTLFEEMGKSVEIYWIGSKSGMDASLVEKNLIENGGSITKFYGIPCGKLRRYLSFQNFTDLFKIVAGYFKSIHLLLKIKPDVVFSKGGFVSVPPCRAAKLLHIPYYTHECDFTPGLATRLNSKAAKNILVTYRETADYFKGVLGEKCLVTGNPVRPVFYADSAAEGRKFLGLSENEKKPVLLVLGGSLGARQVNNLIIENLDWLKERFVVVHQTGKAFADENAGIMASGDDSYKPYAFIYSEMPSVIQSADIVVTRSGANSIWECAVCSKPMILIPLCGASSRGDQVDNAEFFEKNGCASVLLGKDADSAHLIDALTKLSDEKNRKEYAQNAKNLCDGTKPARKIAEIIYNGIIS